ncbi:MAG: 30S ribosomal protein S20 [Armatimonadota bacterium]
MPQRAAMHKHLRQTRVRTQRNRMRKQAMKQAIRQVLEAARSGDAQAVKEALPVAQKAIDKAAQRGIIHQHTAARRKSRLVARARTMLGQA